MAEHEFDKRAMYGFEPVDDEHELCLACLTGAFAMQLARRKEAQAGKPTRTSERWARLAHACKARADILAEKLGIDPGEEPLT